MVGSRVYMRSTAFKDDVSLYCFDLRSLELLGTIRQDGKGTRATEDNSEHACLAAKVDLKVICFCAQT